LIFIKKYDIIYIESERKEMINMKVIKVRAKVVSPKMYTQEQMDLMSAELGSCRSQIMSLKQKTAGYESLYRAAKNEAEEWEKTSKDLANRLCEQMNKTRAAEENAAGLNLELMERECRINELERRIAWLAGHSNEGSVVS
jgi:predicted transcriptional regulator